MVSYKLYYFNIRGRGEVSKMLFEHCKVPYELKEISFAEFEEFKKTGISPTNLLPVLVDEEAKVTLTQSGAIAEYLANKFKLGENLAPVQKSQLFELYGACEDVMQQLVPLLWLPPSDEKIKLITKHSSENIPLQFSRLETLLKNSFPSAVDAKFVADKLNWVFFNIVEVFEFAQHFIQFSTTEYPTLNSLIKNVHDLPSMKSFFGSRSKFFDEL